MDTIKDAQGHGLLDFYNGRPSFEVFERDDGFVNAVYGARQYFSPYRDWAPHERKAIRYARGRCLDVGCAAGRVLLYLQEKGMRATGIDYSPLAVKVCRLRGARDVRQISLERFAMREGKARYDTVVMFGNNFGIFGGALKAKRLLKRLYLLTSPSATILAESRDPYKTDNAVHFAYHRRNIRRGRMPGQLRERIRFMQYSTDWFDYLFVSRDEMISILEGTGWHASRFLYADGYGKNGEYIAIITKRKKA